MKLIKPRIGDEKIIKKFSIFPIFIGDEGRWLEMCYIRQRRGCVSWYDMSWSNKAEYEEYINKKVGIE